MDETGIEFFVCADVVKGIQPMSVIQVCITSEHLTVEVSNVRLKVFGEARGFASPVAAGELRER